MKKFIALCLAIGLVSVASAVTMNWGSATAIKFNNSNLRGDSTVTGYLIAVDSLAESYALTDSFASSVIGTQVDEKNATSNMSKISKDWSIDTANYSNGRTFAVLLKYTGAQDGKVYWNLTSGLVTLNGYALDPPVNAANTSSAFSYATVGESDKLTAGAGWTTAIASTPVIPEPSLAAMALLGLGIMLKRRKA